MNDVDVRAPAVTLIRGTLGQVFGQVLTGDTGKQQELSGLAVGTQCLKFIHYFRVFDYLTACLKCCLNGFKSRRGRQIRHEVRSATQKGFGKRSGRLDSEISRLLSLSYAAKNVVARG